MTIFLIAAAVAVVSTLLALTRMNAIHALLYLIVSLLSLALVFFLLGAPFIAALEVIIYAGAIMVLFVFVVMMFNIGPRTREQERGWLSPRMWLGPGFLSLILIVELIYVFFGSGGSTVAARELPPSEIGKSLFGPYLLAVELASMLLLAGLAGAHHLGRRRIRQ